MLEAEGFAGRNYCWQQRSSVKDLQKNTISVFLKFNTLIKIIQNEKTYLQFVLFLFYLKVQYFVDIRIQALNFFLSYCGSLTKAGILSRIERNSHPRQFCLSRRQLLNKIFSNSKYDFTIGKREAVKHFWFLMISRGDLKSHKHFTF